MLCNFTTTHCVMMTISHFLKGPSVGIQERKGREKEHRKEEILDAAQKIFFWKGLFPATMDEIAEEAELSKGTLYLYYKSKEDLYLAVVMRGIQILYEMVERAVRSQSSTAAALVRLCDTYTEFFRKERKFFRMFYFLQTPQFYEQVSAEMRQACQLVSHRVWELVINIIQRGIDEGLVRSDLNPTEVAISVWSSATALLLRVDSEARAWKEDMNIDLMHTLQKSNELMLSAILTEKGRLEMASSVPKAQSELYLPLENQ